MKTPHLCPRCAGERPRIDACAVCAATGVVWEPPAVTETRIGYPASPYTIPTTDAPLDGVAWHSTISFDLRGRA